MRQYAVEFKIRAVEEYRSTKITRLGIAKKYNIPYSKRGICGTLNNWIVAYDEGRLRMSNAISVSRKKSLKEKTITIDGMMYKEYVKPHSVNVDGIDYVLIGV